MRQRYNNFSTGATTAHFDMVINGCPAQSVRHFLSHFRFLNSFLHYFRCCVTLMWQFMATFAVNINVKQKSCPHTWAMNS